MIATAGLAGRPLVSNGPPTQPRVAAPRALNREDYATLRAIEALIEVLGFPPSIREIQEETGASTTSLVAYRLRKLEHAGYIVRRAGRSRTIRVLRGSAS